MSVEGLTILQASRDELRTFRHEAKEEGTTEVVAWEVAEPGLLDLARRPPRPAAPFSGSRPSRKGL